MKLYILLLILSIPFLTYSQNYIFDIDTKEPIKSVNISYSKNKGLISNEDGFFFLEKNNKINIDTLHLSHLNYSEKKIIFKSLKENDTIFLKKIVINLEDVVISSVNAEKIIKKAIRKIDENYLNTSNNQYGFLRQTLEENGNGIEMIEVAFINYYNNNELSTKITNARRTKNYAKIDFSLTGGVFSAIKKGDFVKRKTRFLDIKKINQYVFKYKGKIIHNNLEVYKISYRSKENSVKNYKNGYIFVDTKSYAIVQIENHFDKQKLSKLEDINYKSLRKKDKRNTLYILRGGSSTIKYKKLNNGKWTLAYLKLRNTIKGENKKDSYFYDVSLDLVINSVEYKKIKSVKTNYNVSKGFNKAIRKIKSLGKWGDNYKFSLSNKDKRILKEIEQHKQRRK